MTRTQTRQMSRGNEPLSNDQLMRVAPSIFAVEPWMKMSEKYTFIPTIQIVEKMRQRRFRARGGDSIAIAHRRQAGVHQTHDPFP